jgi:DNA polymerase
LEKDINNIIEESVKYLKYWNSNKKIPLYKNDFKNYIEPEDNQITIHIENNPDSSEEIYHNDNMENQKIDTIVSDKQELFLENWASCENLTVFENEICKCTKCAIGNTRIKFVFGTGNPESKVVLVGEAPGADEDKEGKPFVGRAGKLLTDILKAINFSRDEVYICNILKCRPPENRNPEPQEISNCIPYLFKQLSLIKPDLILALGSFAAQNLLNLNLSLGKMRGKFYEIIISDKTVKVLVTYHPAALLRNPKWKYDTWEDVKMLRKEYDKISK